MSDEMLKRAFLASQEQVRLLRKKLARFERQRLGYRDVEATKQMERDLQALQKSFRGMGKVTGGF